MNQDGPQPAELESKKLRSVPIFTFIAKTESPDLVQMLTTTRVTLAAQAGWKVKQTETALYLHTFER